MRDLMIRYFKTAQGGLFSTEVDGPIDATPLSEQQFNAEWAASQSAFYQRSNELLEAGRVAREKQLESIRTKFAAVGLTDEEIRTLVG